MDNETLKRMADAEDQAGNVLACGGQQVGTERKCWDCGDVSIYSGNFAPEVCCKKCGSQDTRPIRRQLVNTEPTNQQLHSACLSFHHGYGVMDEDSRQELRQQALAWWKVWRKA